MLHVTPEAGIAEPRAHVRGNDRVGLSVRNREISLLVADKGLARSARDHVIVAPSRARL